MRTHIASRQLSSPSGLANPETANGAAMREMGARMRRTAAAPVDQGPGVLARVMGNLELAVGTLLEAAPLPVFLGTGSLIFAKLAAIPDNPLVMLYTGAVLATAALNYAVDGALGRSLSAVGQTTRREGFFAVER